MDGTAVSVHKTMGGISGTGLILFGKDSKVENSLIEAAYFLFHTTTPSPLLMA